MKTALRTLASVLAFLTLLTLAVSAQTAKKYVLDFTAEGLNDAEAYEEEDGEYTLVISKFPRATINSLDGIEFEAKTLATGAWGLITFTEQSKYTETGLNGVGVKLRYWNEGVEVSIVQAGESWGNHVIASYFVTIEQGKTLINDDTYHKFALSKTGTRWSIKVDDMEVLNDDNYNGDVETAVNALLDGAAYISFGGASYDPTLSSVTVKSAEIIEEEPTTETNEEKPSPETSDTISMVILTSAVVAAAVIATSKKKYI